MKVERWGWKMRTKDEVETERWRIKNERWNMKYEESWNEV